MLKRLLPPPGPVRLYVLISMIITLGQGVWIAMNAVYAVTVLRLSAAQLGLSVSVAAAFVLLSSVPLGHLSDRAGPRTLQVWSFLALAPLTLGFLFARGFWAYLLVVILQGIVYRAGRNARKAMVAGLVPSRDRVSILAITRSTTNGSAAVGTGLAALVLAVGTRPAYQAAIVFIAVTFLVAGLITLREPEVRRIPAPAGPAPMVLRDPPFLAFTVLDGLLSSHAVLLDTVLPLWVVSHTHAPRWAVAVLVFTNMIIVIVTQQVAARGTESVIAAGRASLQGGGCVAAACVVFAFSGAPGLVAGFLLLLLGAVLHALGEVRQAAGSWGISYELAPDHAQGQYQGMHAMGIDIGRMLGPAVFVWLVIDRGAAGWVALGIMFAVLGLAMPPVVSWGLRHRKRFEPQPATV